jgi:hypothetical protein
MPAVRGERREERACQLVEERGERREHASWWRREERACRTEEEEERACRMPIRPQRMPDFVNLVQTW